MAYNISLTTGIAVSLNADGYQVDWQFLPKGGLNRGLFRPEEIVSSGRNLKKPEET